MRRELVRTRSRQVLLVILGVCLALAMATPTLAATRYEYFDGVVDGCWGVNDGSFMAQTFTPSVAHTVTSVRLMVYRIDWPGTVTVGIRATSGGVPTGGDLCNSTIDGNALTDSPGTWYEITLGSGHDLSAGTTYAIVVRAPAANGTNYICWAYHDADAYAGGDPARSVDYGSTWNVELDYDRLFEEWGTAAVGWETYSVNKVRVLAPWIALGVAVAAGGSLLILRRRRTQS